VEVEIGRTTKHHQAGDIFRAEINLSINGKLFRVESEQESLYAAIDEVRDDLEREIKKFKEKRETIFIRGARSIKKKLKISPMARFRK
jgi:putative sigma-54 modulation protein